MGAKYIIKKLYQCTYRAVHRNIIIQDKTEFGLSCKFLGHNLIAYGADLRHVVLGYGSYVGEFSCLRGVSVGRYTSIGPYVKTYIGRHPTERFISTHPAFFSVKPSCGFSYVDRQKYEEIKFSVNDDRRYPIYIGNDVWVGAGTSICDGVTIGDGAIVGANSLVLKDVAPYSIVVGTPAKVIRKRFSQDDIDWLMHEEWWNKKEEWIREHAEYFESMDIFREYCER